ncbi:hypothetical protein OUZ56_016793 [Daphnia magna]|uniref:Uncharacterized protein n=1 Tax=Daphnia magna TaxID=35525 RepID=A0ABR0ARL9_9CRUS|nr:hypothetical protein OUZ56_016793 [Daphnia magna]
MSNLGERAGLFGTKVRYVSQCSVVSGSERIAISSPANHYYSVRPVMRPSGYTTAAPSGRISGPALYRFLGGSNLVPMISYRSKHAARTETMEKKYVLNLNYPNPRVANSGQYTAADDVLNLLDLGLKLLANIDMF